MERKQLSKEEAVQFLTRQRDLALDAQSVASFTKILDETGTIIGYTPTFRCLVKGMEPEQSIRWKE